MMTSGVTIGERTQENFSINNDQERSGLKRHSSGSHLILHQRGEHRSNRSRNHSRSRSYTSYSSNKRIHKTSKYYRRRGDRHNNRSSRYLRSNSRDFRTNKYSDSVSRKHDRNRYNYENRSYATSKYDLDDNDSDQDNVVDNCHRQYHKRRDHKENSTKIASRHPQFSDLPLEWWEREEDCKLAKEYHTEKIDRLWPSREDLVLQTTLAEEETVLEENMFPYNTPKGIAHYTLWSIHDLSHSEIISFVDSWLLTHHPQVRRWQYDDNSGERSILLFHVHVFIEMEPFSFTPRPGLEYLPPHMN